MDHFLVFCIYIFGYNQTIYVSSDCVGGINPFGLFCDCVYCFHSHLSLSIGMVIRYFLDSSYICVALFCICIVHVSVFISFSSYIH